MLDRVRQMEIGRASPLGAWSGWDGEGISLRERRGLAVVELAAHGRGEAARAALSRTLGMVLPGPGGSVEARGVAALSVGPGRWLLVGGAAAVDAVPTPPADEAAFTDLSDGRAILTLTGPHAARLLAKGTAIDLAPAAFADGAVAATALAHVAVVIWRNGAAWHIIVPSSYAMSLLDWLMVAGRA